MLFVLVGVRDDVCVQRVCVFSARACVCVCVCVCVGSSGSLLQNFLKG